MYACVCVCFGLDGAGWAHNPYELRQDRLNHPKGSPEMPEVPLAVLCNSQLYRVVHCTQDLYRLGDGC